MVLRRRTEQTQAVLRFIAIRETYGFEICRAVGLRSGTLYPILDRLLEDGLVRARWETVNERQAGRPRRRYYRLTAKGRKAIESAA